MDDKMQNDSYITLRLHISSFVGPIFRVTTHLENLEKSGNSKLVREKSGEVTTLPQTP